MKLTPVKKSFVLAFKVRAVADCITLTNLTLFDIGLSGIVTYGGHEPPPPNHNFVVIAAMIMKFGTDINFNISYTVATKTFVASPLLRNYDVITRILADA